jgi:GTP cyclohydrolase I
VIDTDSDHNTHETAKRVAKMYIEEVFRGRYVPMPAVTEFPNVERLNELMIVGPITVRSACSTTCARSWARSGSACCPTSTRT